MIKLKYTQNHIPNFEEDNLKYLRNYFIRVYFMKKGAQSSWDSNLGYTADTLYKRYNCLLLGSMLETPTATKNA